MPNHVDVHVGEIRSFHLRRPQFFEPGDHAGVGIGPHRHVLADSPSRWRRHCLFPWPPNPAVCARQAPRFPIRPASTRLRNCGRRNSTAAVASPERRKQDLGRRGSRCIEKCTGQPADCRVHLRAALHKSPASSAGNRREHPHWTTRLPFVFEYSNSPQLPLSRAHPLHPGNTAGMGKLLVCRSVFGESQSAPSTKNCEQGERPQKWHDPRHHLHGVWPASQAGRRRHHQSPAARLQRGVARAR